MSNFRYDPRKITAATEKEQKLLLESNLKLILEVLDLIEQASAKLKYQEMPFARLKQTLSPYQRENFKLEIENAENEIKNTKDQHHYLFSAVTRLILALTENEYDNPYRDSEFEDEDYEKEMLNPRF